MGGSSVSLCEALEIWIPFPILSLLVSMGNPSSFFEFLTFSRFYLNFPLGGTFLNPTPLFFFVFPILLFRAIWTFNFCRFRFRIFQTQSRKPWLIWCSSRVRFLQRQCRERHILELDRIFLFPKALRFVHFRRNCRDCHPNPIGCRVCFLSISPLVSPLFSLCHF